MTTKKKAAAAGVKSLASKGSDTPKAESLQAEQAMPEPLSPAKQQIRVFEEAVQLFAQRKFAAAQARFEEALRGPGSQVTDKARTYVQVCARKTSAEDIHPQTAEDYFNYGVERLNARDMEQARTQFSRALSLQPNAEHIHYTMALACGLSGDGDAAYENLKRAIELEPRNRILARQDPEFTALAHQFPPIRTLLQAEAHGPF